MYIINQNNTKEFVFFVDINRKKIKLYDLFQISKINNIKIGYNENEYNENEFMNMYQL